MKASNLMLTLLVLTLGFSNNVFGQTLEEIMSAMGNDAQNKVSKSQAEIDSLQRLGKNAEAYSEMEANYSQKVVDAKTGLKAQGDEIKKMEENLDALTKTLMELSSKIGESSQSKSASKIKTDRDSLAKLENYIPSEIKVYSESGFGPEREAKLKTLHDEAESLRAKLERNAKKIEFLKTLTNVNGQYEKLIAFARGKLKEIEAANQRKVNEELGLEDKKKKTR